MMEINKDLQRENYWVNIEAVDFLDCCSDFFFAKGRFPGSQELIMVPQAEIPKFVRTQTSPYLQLIYIKNSKQQIQKH